MDIRASPGRLAVLTSGPVQRTIVVGYLALQEMTKQFPAAGGPDPQDVTDLVETPGSRFGAIVGIALIAIALMVAVPVGMNLPKSWPGAVLVLVLGVTGVALVVTHLKLGHRRRRPRKAGHEGS